MRSIAAATVTVVLASSAAAALTAAETLRRDHVDASRLARLPAGTPLAELVKALGDPWTRVLDASDAKAFLAEVSGAAHVGVGLPELLSLDIDARSGAPVIVTPLPGSPAARAGLLPGDRLTSIDGAATGGLPFQEVMRKLRGPAGTEVKLGAAWRGRAGGDPAAHRAACARQRSRCRIVPGRPAPAHPPLWRDHTRRSSGGPEALPEKPRRARLARQPGGGLDSALQIAGLFVGRVEVAAMQRSQGIRKLSGTTDAPDKSRSSSISEWRR